MDPEKYKEWLAIVNLKYKQKVLDCFADDRTLLTQRDIQEETGLSQGDVSIALILLQEEGLVYTERLESPNMNDSRKIYGRF